MKRHPDYRRSGGPDSFKKFINREKALIDRELKRCISKNGKYPEIMYKAIEHALFPGGKRIRPVLTLLTAEMFGVKSEEVLPTACGIELIHNYSLIHDDLPSMDNDKYRRGKLTVHCKYGECVAVLAGDALLTEAFRLFVLNSRKHGISEKSVLEVIKVVSQASGLEGMIGGQTADTILSSRRHVNRNLLDYVYTKKTAALIEVSVISGAILSRAKPDEIKSLKRYGQCIGLAFQIVDDIFDLDKGKLTYPAVYGMEKSRDRAGRLIDRAKKSLELFGRNAYMLNKLADYVINRKN